MKWSCLTLSGERLAVYDRRFEGRYGVDTGTKSSAFMRLQNGRYRNVKLKVAPEINTKIKDVPVPCNNPLTHNGYMKSQIICNAAFS